MYQTLWVSDRSVTHRFWCICLRVGWPVHPVALVSPRFHIGAPSNRLHRLTDQWASRMVSNEGHNIRNKAATIFDFFDMSKIIRWYFLTFFDSQKCQKLSGQCQKCQKLSGQCQKLSSEFSWLYWHVSNLKMYTVTIVTITITILHKVAVAMT